MANSDNVRVGYAGFAYWAPKGTAGPTDLATAWASGWKDLGLILADDGISESNEEERDSFYAMGVDAPVRVQSRQKTTSFGLTFMETNPYTLSLYHGIPLADMEDIVVSTETVGISFEEGANHGIQEFALGLDIVDGDKVQRIVIPRAIVTETGDRTYKADEVAGFQLTFQAMLSSTNVSLKRYIGGLELPA